MHASHVAVRLSLLSVALALSAASAGATTLIRLGVDRLTIGSQTVVQAAVLHIHSYWNDDHQFILTDVRVRPSQFLKGTPSGDVTFTVMGGTVGDVTTLILGGADLAPGSEYMLFLGRADLPGAANRLTIRDHSQGVFEIVRGRAISQASGESMLPDEQGTSDAPGGREGLDLDELVGEIRSHSNR